MAFDFSQWDIVDSDALFPSEHDEGAARDQQTKKERTEKRKEKEG